MQNIPERKERRKHNSHLFAVTRGGALGDATMLASQ
jgi:hypothetical protein